MEASVQMIDSITTLIRSIEAFDSLEQAHITQTLDWIASGGAPIFRTAKPAMPPQHLVSYFVLFDPSQAKILLVDHKNAGLWLPAGGHVELGEHPTTTVEREVVEELGIAAKFLFDEPLFLTVSATVGMAAVHTDVSLWYILQGDAASDPWFDSGEFHQVCWFALNDLPTDRCDPHLQRFVAKLTNTQHTVHNTRS